jgi:hypothetical protein
MNNKSINNFNLNIHLNHESFNINKNQKMALLVMKKQLKIIKNIFLKKRRIMVMI